MALAVCGRRRLFLALHVPSSTLYKSSPTAVISGYAFCGETELPATTDKESPRGGFTQGHKAGLFAVRKPEGQAASF